MRVDNLHQLVCVLFFPENFQLLIVIVTKEYMCLCYEVAIGVLLKRLLHPIDHFCGNLRILFIVIEWIHAIEAKNHCITTELHCIVTATAPC